MCLCTNNKKPETAERPVECYKVVWKMPWDTPAAELGHFLSEFQCFPYSLGAEYSLDGVFPRINAGGCLRISEGFHSYARLIDACERCWDIYTKSIREEEAKGFYGRVILRCEIPAGATYWEGSDGLCPEYCSDRIRVTGWKLNSETKWRTCVKEDEPCA